MSKNEFEIWILTIPVLFVQNFVIIVSHRLNEVVDESFWRIQRVHVEQVEPGSLEEMTELRVGLVELRNELSIELLRS